MQRKLYLDIDGVLLKSRVDKPVEGIHELILFIVCNFDCYWLTTHCKGNSQTAIEYLSEYLDVDDIALLKAIKPTNWNTLKTEAIDFGSDFFWIDDYVMRAEKEILALNGKSDSLILFNESNEDEVNKVITEITNKIFKVMECLEYD